MNKPVGQINLERWIKPEHLEQLYTCRRNDPWINALLNTLEDHATPQRVIDVMVEVLLKLAEARLELLTILTKVTTTQLHPPVTLPVNTVPTPERSSRKFVNEVGNAIEIHVALGDGPSNLCRLMMISPHSTMENYATRMELEQLRDAINEVLPKSN